MNNFNDYNSWRILTVGKAKIMLNDDDTISHIDHGRVSRVGKSAAEYIAARPKLAQAVRDFILARREAATSWKHDTPHLRYDCDRGSLAIKVNGATVLIGNRYGDGNHPVYILNSKTSSSMPPEFSPIGLSIDGSAEIEVMDYDCGGANVVGTVNLAKGQDLWVYVGNGGAVALVVR